MTLAGEMDRKAFTAGRIGLGLVLMTVTRAFRAQFARHRAVARWTLPLWIYVSVTGVIVYWMLYRM